MGRVTNSEPFLASRRGANGATGPDALPKVTIMPRGRSEAIEPSHVSAPTESYATATPAPSVISATRSATSSSR